MPRLTAVDPATATDPAKAYTEYRSAFGSASRTDLVDRRGSESLWVLCLGPFRARQASRSVTGSNPGKPGWCRL